MTSDGTNEADPRPHKPPEPDPLECCGGGCNLCVYDRYWDALTKGGGEPGVCGWLKDRFGVSWQVIPRQLNEMLESSDRAAAGRAMEAMLKMTKIDVEGLRRAYEGTAALAR